MLQLLNLIHAFPKNSHSQRFAWQWLCWDAKMGELITGQSLADIARSKHGLGLQLSQNISSENTPHINIHCTLDLIN